ncbi:unnamed protein product [Choristocarpus tenellus]
MALLCDFGLSNLLRHGLDVPTMIDCGGEEGVEGICLWPLRQAPPKVLNLPYTISPESDVYMFGTMLFELFSGEAPFAGVSNTEAVALILEGKPLKPPSMLVKQGGHSGVQLFQDCLSGQAANRPTMEHVVTRLENMLAPPKSWTAHSPDNAVVGSSLIPCLSR